MGASVATRKGGAKPVSRGKSSQQVEERSAGSADIGSAPKQLQRTAGRATQKGGMPSNAPVAQQGKAAVFHAGAVQKVIDAVRETQLGSGGWNTGAVAKAAEVPHFSVKGAAQVVKAVEAIGGGQASISCPPESAGPVNEDEAANEGMEHERSLVCEAESPDWGETSSEKQEQRGVELEGGDVSASGPTDLRELRRRRRRRRKKTTSPSSRRAARLPHPALRT